MSKFQRSSGILLHVTSLPGPYGIGDIGEMAYHWVDFLAQAGQRIWQILPLGPTGYGNSPYQTISVFAGNPLLIDLKPLQEAGLISAEALQNRPEFPANSVDFEAVIGWKIPLLLGSYSRFLEKGDAVAKVDFDNFCEENDAKWLDDFALFMAIKYDQGEAAWFSWPKPLKMREDSAIADARQKLAAKIMAHKFVQFIFFEQWHRLKNYAAEKGVAIMGDIPIYVTLDSAEVWADKKFFRLDKEGDPTHVAGVPPDYFSKTGQLWGNPIYDWKTMKKDRFQWWINRIKLTLDTVHIARIDHFRGFEAYWAVPYGEETAVNGEWVKSPGVALFDALRDALGDVPIIVEDLGLITPEVEALRNRYDFPGMKILQFAFGGDATAPFLPHNYDDNCVVYTGSHDNDTTVGWFQSAPAKDQQYCRQYIGAGQDDIAGSLIRLAAASTASISIFPLQDVLSLGPDARMNTPGSPSDNWCWRLSTDQLQPHHAEKLAKLSNIFGRNNHPLEAADNSD